MSTFCQQQGGVLTDMKYVLTLSTPYYNNVAKVMSVRTCFSKQSIPYPLNLNLGSTNSSPTMLYSIGTMLTVNPVIENGKTNFYCGNNKAVNWDGESLSCTLN